MNEVVEKATIAKEQTVQLSNRSSKEKNDALRFIATKLDEQSDYLLSENQKDVDAAIEKGASAAIVDRLTLSQERINDMIKSIHLLIELDDPIGKIQWEDIRPNGLNIKKVTVPLGVIGMIYEARPNVTIDAATLSVKTGNAILLRGSTSTLHSNKAIVSSIHQGLEQSTIPKESVQLIEEPDRELVKDLYHRKDLIDVLIPRGGKVLIDTVVQQSSVPVLETGAGNCHVYVDESADVDMAIEVIINAKTQRPSVCNACETIIVHEKWAERHFNALINELKQCNVGLRGDEKATQYDARINVANELDWETEYLDLTLAVRIVESIEEAIGHIRAFGTKHSEAILSDQAENVELFFNNVDASTVYHNASTRFTDGFEFGFGAEIGISTQKLHARGPMGLEALTTTKYHVYGQGQIK
ncbi:glutamate-5-semialdehyde dehydrogenase [Salipaludibacillus keqinensis]|uniref:Gamma-glutamyl phosphate reductase n=1 Tax=Salipaludibacillus keqinensis TaxID=2045207 RepID=A0A323TM92_9BACI|nr:glutamate-5-semialdehyde dehydrogenase [Salipaludibacillus keqinensis]PYZ95156.1 glutamate-5-semialdehyde dehydrogenase [Salipaludibacillus keqinensis]